MKHSHSLTRKNILLGYTVLCAVLSVAAVIAVFLEHRADSTEAAAAPVITAFESNATTLSYVRGDDTFTLSTTGDVWTMASDATIPLNDTTAFSVANAVSHLTAVRSFPAEDVVLADYGLNDTGAFSLTASNLAGEAAALIFGNLTTDGETRYVLSEGTIYTVNAAEAETLDCDFFDLLEYDTMPDILPSDLVLLTITRDDKRLELGYTADGLESAYETGFCWYIGYPYDEPQEADEQNAHSLFYDVTGLYFYDCAAFRPEDFSVYGFDTPLCTADICWTDEYGDEVTTTLIFGSETEDGYIYVRFADSDMVLLANASIANQIAYAAAADLLPRQVCAIQLDTVESITVTTDDGCRTFTDFTADDFMAFYEALTAIVSTVRAPEVSPNSAVLKVHFSRTTTHDEDMTLCYYIYDGTYYLASFDGRQDQLVDSYTLKEVLELYKAIA